MQAYGNPRIRPAVTIEGVGTCSDRLTVAAARLAQETRTLAVQHKSTSEREVEMELAVFGERPIEHCARIGALNPYTLLNHVTSVDEGEVTLLADSGARVSQNPSSALKLAKGTTQTGKWPELIRAGVPMGLGTDAENVSNHQDVCRAIYLAALLPRDARRDPNAVSAEQAVELGTLGGARALLFDDVTGSLDVGKQADLVVFDTDDYDWRPLHNPVANLAYGGHRPLGGHRRDRWPGRAGAQEEHRGRRGRAARRRRAGQPPHPQADRHRPAAGVARVRTGHAAVAGLPPPAPSGSAGPVAIFRGALRARTFGVTLIYMLQVARVCRSTRARGSSRSSPPRWRIVRTGATACPHAASRSSTRPWATSTSHSSLSAVMVTATQSGGVPIGWYIGFSFGSSPARPRRKRGNGVGTAKMVCGKGDESDASSASRDPVSGTTSASTVATTSGDVTFLRA